jgi:Transposase DDE domain group 1
LPSCLAIGLTLCTAEDHPVASVSPTHGEQEMSLWNRHYACACYPPLFVFNQFGDLERCALPAGNVHSAAGWADVLKPVGAETRENGQIRILEQALGLTYVRRKEEH